MFFYHNNSCTVFVVVKLRAQALPAETICNMYYLRQRANCSHKPFLPSIICRHVLGVHSTCCHFVYYLITETRDKDCGVFFITKRLRDTWQVDTWQIVKHGRWWFTYRCVTCDSSEWNDWYNVWRHRNNDIPENDIPETTSSHVQCQQHRRLHARTLDQAVLKLTRIMCAVQHKQVTCWRKLTTINVMLKHAT